MGIFESGPGTYNIPCKAIVLNNHAEFSEQQPRELGSFSKNQSPALMKSLSVQVLPVISAPKKVVALLTDSLFEAYLIHIQCKFELIVTTVKTCFISSRGIFFTIGKAVIERM
jgi:hypothetical protein